MKNRTLQTNMMMRVVLATLMCLVGFGKISAQDFTVGDLNYSVNEGGTTVTVTGHVNGTSAMGTLEIPESVSYEGISYAVTAIGDWAFSWCESLSGNLTIPNSVTAIGEAAFSGCYGFSSLSIGNSVALIGDYAFDYCRGFTGDLVIPNSVTSIGEAAFSQCEGLTGTLSLSASLTSIQDYTFAECNFTGSLILPSFVTSIGNWAFDGNEFTGELLLPNTVVSIGDGAFSVCTGFTGQLIIPDAVTKIGADAFSYCFGFYGELNIPSHVEKIGERAFSDSYFSSFNVDSQNEHYKSENGVLFTYGMDTLMQYPRGKYATSYDIPNTVTRISTYAFCNMDLTSITIPNSVVSIGPDAFSNTFAWHEINNIYYLDGWCLGGEWNVGGSVNIEEGTRGIADEAFMNCQELTGTLNIPNSVVYIGNRAFGGCGFTGPLVIPNSVKTIGKEAFSTCEGFSGEFFFGNSVTSIGKWAFAYCTGVNGSFTIPASTISIGESPFWGCDGIEYIIVDSENTVYDSRNGCNAIIETATNTLINGCKNTIMPNSVTSIGNRAFTDCQGMTSPLIIPNSVVTIGDWAFRGCDGLTSPLIIPNSVVKIGEGSFWDCGVDIVVSLNTVPPIIEGEFSPFDYPNLIVRCGSKEAYEASDWANCVSTIEEDCSPHNVIIDEGGISGGNVSASVSSTELGEEVQLTITPDEGMMLASLTVSNANDLSQFVPVYPIGKATSMWGFIMPPFDVVITATFVPATTIGENNEALALVYPNPTSGNITIEMEDLKYITISNTLGQIIDEGGASGYVFEYDFGKHGEGLYFIRIETASGVALKKVLVAR